MTEFYYIPQKKLAVFWSPKCASSGMAIWLKKYIKLKCDEGYIQYNNLYKDPRIWLNKNGYLYPRWQTIKPLSRDGIKVLVFLSRNPYSRIISSYFNKFVFYNGKILKNLNQLELFAQNFIVKYSKANFENKPSIDKNGNFFISLFEFINVIDKTKNLLDLNDHFRPQISSAEEFKIIKLLLESKYVSEKLILRTESFSKDISELNKIIKFDFIPPKVNFLKSKGWKLVDDMNVIKLKNNELIKKKLLPTKEALESFISTNNLCNLNHFEYDFEIFNKQLN